jgi:predicted lipid carrier protein YhbT
MTEPNDSIAQNPTPPSAGILASLPVPLFVVRLVFGRLILALARRHPSLFSRLGRYGSRSFLIDPTDMPLVLRLYPDAGNPRLEPFSRDTVPDCDAVIAGPLMKLVRLVSGKEDGDALFFSRELEISGDTEAVLALRNAIDDMDMDLGAEIESLLGPLAGQLRVGLEQFIRLSGQVQNSLLAPALERTARLEREIGKLREQASGRRTRPARRAASGPKMP